MKRTLFPFVALVVGVLIGASAILGLQRLGREEMRGIQYGGTGKADAKVGKSYTFDGGSVCVTGSIARITSVRPRHAQGGLTVTGFKLVDDIRTDHTTDVVTTTCKETSDDGQRLFVDVKANKLPAAADGYVINYTLDGRKAATTSKNWVLLCDPGHPESDLITHGDLLKKCGEPSWG